MFNAQTMTNPFSAFVAPVVLPNNGLSAISSSLCAPSISVPRLRTSTPFVITPKMEQTKAAPRKDKSKKRAAPTFSTDMKGNIVWNLRSAKPEDIDAICPLVEHLLPRSLVESLVSGSPCCTICEASVKGTKEGEGFSSTIMGVVLVDIVDYTTEDESLDQESSEPSERYGHLVTIVMDEDFTEEDAPKKLLLGSLKKMKEYKVVEVTHATEFSDRADLITNCLFKPDGKNDLDFPSYICNLKFENPDPLKKIM